MSDHYRVRVLLALFIPVVLGASLLTPPPQAFLRTERNDKPVAALAAPKRPAPIQPLPVPQPAAVAGQKSPTLHREEATPAVVPGLSGLSAIIHTVERGESFGSLVYHYLPQSVFLTTGELESAIRQANPDWPGKFLRPGQQLAIPGMATTPIVEKPVLIPKGSEIRAIYLTGLMAGSPRGLELVRRWHELGGNAVVFDVKDMDGSVSVPFEHPLAPPTRRPPIPRLPKYTRYLHTLGFHVIARLALFRDAQLAEHHPDLAVRSRHAKQPWLEKGKRVWVDPSRREVQDYNLALAKHAVSSGVDEIQFDYVRFPAEGDEADAEFSFQSEHPQWTRSQVISGFLERAYAELHPLGVLVSVDVFGVMAWQRPVDLAHTGQDIARMARFCDVLSPMVYPSHFFGMEGYAKPGDAPEHFIAESMRRFREITGGTGAVLRPWLQAFGWRTKTYSPGYVLTQVNVAKGNGGIGYLFWNARNDYSVPFHALGEMKLVAEQLPDTGHKHSRRHEGSVASAAAAASSGALAGRRPSPPAIPSRRVGTATGQ